MPAALRVSIISDGKRGHENQSRVVARMLGDTEPVVMLLRPGIHELPLRLRFALLGRSALSRSAAEQLVQRMLAPENNNSLRELALEYKTHGSELKLCSVSTGTPPATLNLVMSRMLGCPALTCMTPSLLPRRSFDLNIVPEHDFPRAGRRPANVVTTPLALGYHDAPAATLLAHRLRSEHELGRRPRLWGVAVGGPSRACPWQAGQTQTLLAHLLAVAAQQNAALMLTTSRRTPESCLKWLAEQYVPAPSAAYYLDAAQDPLNPLPAFYELCERIFVTNDSYSMVCEAIHAGHRPHVLLAGQPPPGSKFDRGYTALSRAGLYQPVPDGAALSAQTATSPSPRLAINLEYERLRTEVRQRLDLSPA